MEFNKLYLGDNVEIMKTFPDESVDLIYMDSPYGLGGVRYHINETDVGLEPIAITNKNGNIYLTTQGLADTGTKRNSKHNISNSIGSGFGDVPTPTHNLTKDQEKLPPNTLNNGPFIMNSENLPKVKSSTLVSVAREEDKYTIVESYKDWTKAQFKVNMDVVLKECHRVLKKTGTIYVQAPPQTGYIVRQMLNDIFGENNWLSEIVWLRDRGASGPKTKARKFAICHDYIYMYKKGPRHNFNRDKRVIPYTEKELLKNYPYDDKDGNGPYAVNSLWCGSQEFVDKLQTDGRYIPKTANSFYAGYKVYLKDLDKVRGRQIGSVWTDINLERVDFSYATRKPFNLLKRIIECSSNQDEVVLDPFAGSCTTCVVAKRLNRRYIGIDINSEAIKLGQQRLDEVEPILTFEEEWKEET